MSATITASRFLVGQAMDLITALANAFDEPLEVIQTTTQPGFLDCCEDNQVVFWMSNASPDFRRGGGGNCPAMNVTWTIQLARCVELDDEGSMAPDVWISASHRALEDLETIMCAATSSRDEVFSVQSGTVIGPEAGCVTAQVVVQSYFELC